MAKATKTAAAQAPVTAIAAAFETAAAQAPAPAAIVAHRDETTAALILQAGQAAASMLELCKQAGKAAAAQLNPATPIGQRIADVVALYSADFATAGHNVKSLFVDALTLHAAAQTPVTVKAMVNGKATDVHLTAEKAADMPKHAMRDAAKQVRESIGTARKTSTKTKTKPAPKMPAAPAAPDMTVTMAEVDGFSQWLANLDAYLTDAIFHQKIVARAIECGFVITKATKGTVVKGKASA
jgi:hypothetical protein